MPSGSIYTFTGVANPSNNTTQIETSQGFVALGTYGYFLPAEVQAATADGLILQAGIVGTAVAATAHAGPAITGSDGTVGGPGGSPLASSVVNGVQQTIQLGRSGSLFVTTGQGRYTIPFAGVIISAFASVGTAPTGASVIVDVKKNGTTIFTTQANRPTIAVGTNVSATAIPDVTVVAAGDYITADVAQIGSTIAGADLTVQVLWRAS